MIDPLVIHQYYNNTTYIRAIWNYYKAKVGHVYESVQNALNMYSGWDEAMVVDGTLVVTYDHDEHNYTHSYAIIMQRCKLGNVYIVQVQYCH